MSPTSVVAACGDGGAHAALDSRLGEWASHGTPREQLWVSMVMRSTFAEGADVPEATELGLWSCSGLNNGVKGMWQKAQPWVI